MKRILFNATHPEELRVAIVDGQRLLDLDLESAVRAQKKGNIYKAKVTRVEPSLEAAFVDYGADRHGFLPFKEIYRGYFQNYNNDKPLNSLNIQDVIKEGQELIVQVSKDERGNKGAALTTFISLAGRFLVLMPNNPKGGGISRRITGKQRSELKAHLDKLELESRHALIARTAGVDRSEEELRWDLDFLSDLWEAIEAAADSVKAPALIYQESNLIVRTIRDSLNDHVQELIIDEPEIFERAQRFVKQVMPHNAHKIKMHEGATPLFSRFQIEGQIESAFSRDVQLKSGGSIVIDHTEALIAVDVNSARATKGGDIEETALQTNLEAVEEVARQLRIRDLGGLIVIDLIDMYENANQRQVEAKLREALKLDRARVQVGRISQFGMLEMSRQRLRSSIGDANYHTCPRCEGTGHIRSVVSNSLNLLRLIEEEAIKENTESVQVYLSLRSAAYLLNEKRRELAQLESRVATRVIIIPSAEFENPHFQIKRMRSNDLDEAGDKPSFELAPEIDADQQLEGISTQKARVEKPMVGLEQMTPNTPPPSRATAQAKTGGEKPVGFLARVWSSIAGSGDTAKAEEETKATNNLSPRQKPANARGGKRGGRGSSQRGGRQGSANNKGGKKAKSTGSNNRGGAPRGRGRNAASKNANGNNKGTSKAANTTSGSKTTEKKPATSRGRGGGAKGRSTSATTKQGAKSAKAPSKPRAPAKKASGNTKVASEAPKEVNGNV